MGVLMVHSASMTSHPSQHEQIYLSRHLTFLTFGIAAGLAVSFLPTRFWYRFAPICFAVAIGLLVLVLIPGIGTRVNGAQRWLRCGAITMQPAEFAKLALPLFLARILVARKQLVQNRFAEFLVPCLPVLLVVPLVMRQPDLGTGLFLAIGAGVLLFAASWPLRHFAVIGVTAIPAVVYLVMHKPYQMKRIAGFLDAWTNPEAAPYQLKQSLMTLGTGGAWGTGLGRGWQKLSFLPEANTDFVFAVIGEEIGLAGTLGVIGLWGGVYVLGLRLLSHLRRDSFAYLAGLTLLFQVIFQAAVNVAVVTAMVPPKGIPHPLMSYGGSNLVTTLLAIGIILGLTREESAVDPQSAISTPQ